MSSRACQSMWHYRAGFASEQCPEGFVAVVKSSLRILTLERLGETFNQTSVPLRYTPRGFALDEANRVSVCLGVHQSHTRLDAG